MSSATEPATEPEIETALRELHHEIGNALAAASAHVQFLLRRLPAWADTREQQGLVAIRDCIMRAVHLLGTGSTSAPPTGYDVQRVVALAISQVAPERAADLRLPALTAPPMIAWGHSERIVQVLANLLDNAVKYSLAGTPIEVETCRFRHGATDGALIVVRDEGIGLDRGGTHGVFTGHRTDAACRTAAGAGIGLQLSRRLIEAEGGQLWATGMPGCGSTFYVHLPLGTPDAARAAELERLLASSKATNGDNPSGSALGGRRPRAALE